MSEVEFSIDQNHCTVCLSSLLNTSNVQYTKPLEDENEGILFISESFVGHQPEIGPSHVFHHECGENYILAHKKCPTCKEEVSFEFISFSEESVLRVLEQIPIKEDG